MINKWWIYDEHMRNIWGTYGRVTPLNWLTSLLRGLSSQGEGVSFCCSRGSSSSSLQPAAWIFRWAVPNWRSGRCSPPPSPRSWCQVSNPPLSSPCTSRHGLGWSSSPRFCFLGIGSVLGTSFSSSPVHFSPSPPALPWSPAHSLTSSTGLCTCWYLLWADLLLSGIPSHLFASLLSSSVSGISRSETQTFNIAAICAAGSQIRIHFRKFKSAVFGSLSAPVLPSYAHCRCGIWGHSRALGTAKILFSPDPSQAVQSFHKLFPPFWAYSVHSPACSSSN